MKRVLAGWAVAASVLVLMSAILSGRSSEAQGTTPSPASDQATISALQTENADLKTQLAESISPTATPQPARPTVAASPVPLADDLALLYYDFKKDSAGTTRILGEIKNTSDHTTDAPSIGFVFYDKDGDILGTSYALPLYLVIGKAKAMPFEGTVDAQVSRAGRWDHVEVKICRWNQSDIEKYNIKSLKLQQVQETTRSGNKLLIEGSVKNTGADDVSYVAVAAAIYGPDGHYAGSIVDYLLLPVPAGKSERFTIDDNVNLFRSNDPLDIVDTDYTDSG
jgi:hypothetical protein